MIEMKQERHYDGGNKLSGILSGTSETFNEASVVLAGTSERHCELRSRKQSRNERFGLLRHVVSRNDEKRNKKSFNFKK